MAVTWRLGIGSPETLRRSMFTRRRSDGGSIWLERVTVSAGVAVPVLCGTLNFGCKIEPVLAGIACSDGGVGVSVTSLWLIVRPQSQKLNLQELGQN